MQIYYISQVFSLIDSYKRKFKIYKNKKIMKKINNKIKTKNIAKKKKIYNEKL